MIVVRFKITCQAGKADQALAAMHDVITPSRALDGVVSFDIGQTLDDPNSIIATEVFEDRAALDRQESLPEVAKVMSLLPELVAAEPEATIFEVSAAKPHS